MTFSGRILVVDDFADWRRFVRTKLQEYPGLRIVAEASDGQEAVEKAHELQPDLIVLDISLPTMNGIEVARQIGLHMPNAKILFFSETRSWDVVEEALRIGVGYVIKADATAELLPAVEAVLEGRRFLSSTFAVRTHNESDSQSSEKHKTVKMVAPLAPQNVRIRHEVEFYADDRSLVDGFARLVHRVLGVGNPAIVVASEAHRSEILSQLRVAGVDTDRAIKTGNYISLNATEVLSAIMHHGFPDPVRCENLVNEMIVGPAKHTNRVHARMVMCAECAPTLLYQGNAEGAVQLEHHWDEISTKYTIDTLCGYIGKLMPDDESVIHRICAEHSAVHGHQLAYVQRNRQA
jgi:DNA-binding NarL/FixJ family response regulator